MLQLFLSYEKFRWSTLVEYFIIIFAYTFSFICLLKIQTIVWLQGFIYSYISETYNTIEPIKSIFIHVNQCFDEYDIDQVRFIKRKKYTFHSYFHILCVYINEYSIYFFTSYWDVNSCWYENYLIYTYIENKKINISTDESNTKRIK